MRIYDVIVIGSGLGGLISAALLAKKGASVLIIEKHNLPGGYLSNFYKHNLCTEMAMHQIAGIRDDKTFSRVLKCLNIQNEINFVSLQARCCFSYLSNNIQYIIPSSRDKHIDYLCKEFPHEKNNIIIFYNKCFRIRNSILIENISCPEVQDILNLSAFDFLNNHFSDKTLKEIISSTYFFYSDNLSSLSAIAFASAHASYIAGGTSFIQGGSKQLIDLICKSILNNNGNFLFNCNVEEIILNENQSAAIGVIASHNPNSKKKYHARNIICNASLPYSINTFFNNSNYCNTFFRSIQNNKVADLEISPSAFAVLLFFCKCPSSLGKDYSHFSYVFSEQTSDSPYSSTHMENGFIFSNYQNLLSKKDTHEPGYKQNIQLTSDHITYFGSIMTLDYFYSWKYLDKRSYQQSKQSKAQKMLAMLYCKLPLLKNIVVDYVIATPTSFERFTNNSNGAIYGIEQTVENVLKGRLPCKYLPIDNLYFSSAWVEYGHGINNVLKTGELVANKIFESL